MKYSRFELLVLIFGGGAILATTAMALARQTDRVEVAAQLLLLAVLVGALHWGRKGGFIAGVGAAIVYVGLRVAKLDGTASITPTLAQLLITRCVVFGAIGVVGGEICTRIKYVFLKLEDRDYIDDITHLYNTIYVRQLLRSHAGRFERYQAQFSLILLQVDETHIPPLQKPAGRRLLREVATALIGDVRLVDEMGRLDGAEFCVILPNTPLAGAKIAAQRLTKTAAAALRGRGIPSDGIVTTQALGYPENKDGVWSVIGEEAPSENSHLSDGRAEEPVSEHLKATST